MFRFSPLHYNYLIPCVILALQLEKLFYWSISSYEHSTQASADLSLSLFQFNWEHFDSIFVRTALPEVIIIQLIFKIKPTTFVNNLQSPVVTLKHIFQNTGKNWTYGKIRTVQAEGYFFYKNKTMNIFLVFVSYFKL